MFRKTIAAICSLAAVMALASCGDKNISISESSTNGAGASVSDTDKTSESNTENNSESNTVGSSTSDETEASTEDSIDFGEVVKNFTAPQDGEKIVIMTIKGYGDIKIKLFPEYAEKGVENFLTLTDDGYYDGLIFHRIIDEFMIQGGDPTGTGRGGSSIWGEKFEGGIDPHLVHVAGAVAYANSGSTSTNGSQFYIVTGKTFVESQFDPSYPTAAKEAYLKSGGYPWLDGNYTVFGQVFDGLDIVFELQKVQTDSNNKPLDDVVIESMKVAEYNGEELKWYITDYK